MTKLRVDALRSLADAQPLRERMDALDLASRRPCPFSTFEYLQTLLGHDEFRGKVEDERLLLLAAFDDERLVGYLPLRTFRDHIYGIPYHRVGVAVWHDTDRPHVVARAEDERRCAEAFYEHLFEREKSWSFLELEMQDEASALCTVPAVSPLRFYTRRFDTMPNTTIPLGFTSLGQHFASLSKSLRRNVQRGCRHLIAAGRVESIVSSDPRARLPLLELYLDLERRSWKEAAHAGIRRHPTRVELFRSLCDARQPMAIGVELLLLDGLVVGGVVRGEYAGGLYGLEMAFDDAFESVAPGHLLAMMMLHRGHEDGFHSYNLDGNYSYYKARLGGVVTPTSAVQIYRVGSLPWLKARAGEVKRRLRPPSGAAEAFNPERRKVARAAEADEDEAPRGPAHAWPDRTAERALAKRTLDALEAQGVRLARLSGAEIERAMPFTVRGKTAA